MRKKPELKLAPPYKVSYHPDGSVTPWFRHGSWVAFKIWHKRAMDARDAYNAEHGIVLSSDHDDDNWDDEDGPAGGTPSDRDPA